MRIFDLFIYFHSINLFTGLSENMVPEASHRWSYRFQYGLWCQTPSDNDPLVSFSWGSFAKSHPTPLQFNMGFKQKQTMIFLLDTTMLYGLSMLISVQSLRCWSPVVGPTWVEKPTPGLAVAQQMPNKNTQLGLKIGYPQISYYWTSLSLLKNHNVGCKPHHGHRFLHVLPSGNQT